MELVKNTNSSSQYTPKKRRGALLKSARVNKAVKSAKASLAVEGLHLTESEEELIRLRLQGEISEAEFNKIAWKMING